MIQRVVLVAPKTKHTYPDGKKLPCWFCWDVHAYDFRFKGTQWWLCNDCRKVEFPESGNDWVMR